MILYLYQQNETIMKTKIEPIETVKLFRVFVDGLFFDDISDWSTYQNFPVDHNVDYFQWSTSLDKKLAEFNKARVFWSKCSEETFYAEVRLVFCEVEKSWYDDFTLEQIAEGDRDEAINYKCDYDWTEIAYKLKKRK